MIPNATCVVNPALARNVFLRGPIRAMDYIYAGDPESLLDRCTAELTDGSSLIVFPEGTRTPNGQRRPFRRGAANIALASGAPILPIRIHCAPAWLDKQHKWHYVPPTPSVFLIDVGEPIATVPYRTMGPRSIVSRILTRDLQNQFRPAPESTD
jgi:1-acyl-sn-glycerol-3-phosphate acyltransferase